MNIDYFCLAKAIGCTAATLIAIALISVAAFWIDEQLNKDSVMVWVRRISGILYLLAALSFITYLFYGLIC